MKIRELFTDGDWVITPDGEIYKFHYVKDGGNGCVCTAIGQIHRTCVRSELRPLFFQIGTTLSVNGNVVTIVGVEVIPNKGYRFKSKTNSGIYVYWTLGYLQDSKNNVKILDYGKN